MKEKKTRKLLTQIVCLFLCVFTLFSVVDPSLFVYAGEDTEFYTNGEDELEELFSLTIKDVIAPTAEGVALRAMVWLFKNDTFIVVRRDRDHDGALKYMIFVNTPNVQQWIQNQALGFIPDGFEDGTYTPENRIIKEVGKSNDNAMYKFGFDIGTNKYRGEYPRITMNISNLFPTSMVQTLWRGLKALFGFSVIPAPDKSTYNTLRYYNHHYLNASEEKLIQFFMNNHNKIANYIYFGATLPNGSSYFTSPEDVKDKGSVTKQMKESAEAWNTAHEDDYNEALKKVADYQEWEELYSTRDKMYENCPEYRTKWDERANWSLDGHLPEGWTYEYDPYLDIPIFFDENGIQRPRPESCYPPEWPDWEDFQVGDYAEPPEPSEEDLKTIETYEENEAKIEKYKLFNEYMTNGTTFYKGSAINYLVPWRWDDIGYNKRYVMMSQCLLNTNGESDENKEHCIKRVGGQETSGTVYDFWIRSGIYENFRKAQGRNNMTRREALAIISKLQKFFGPAYEETMSYFTVIIQTAADKRNESIEIPNIIEPRVMPYDTETLKIKQDTEDVYITDPRVQLYKETSFIGGYITDEQINTREFVDVPYMIQRWALSIGGKIGAVGCFLASWTNFEFIENLGLKPTDMWNSFPTTLIISLISVLLIISLAYSSFKFVKGNGSVRELIVKAISFLSCIGLITMLTLYPTQTWGTIKRASNIAFNSGEQMSAMKSLDELYGGDKVKNASVTYYIPYFNLWTNFMTGYNLTASEQKINLSDGTPEVQQLVYSSGDNNLPKIGTVETRLWSVVLADALNSQGKSYYKSTLNGLNGDYVNNNAYRVVDHFMAPRLTTNNPSNSGLDITNTVNENYNGKFQKSDFFEMTNNLILVGHVTLLALIKFLTFIWFWYMLYTLVFNIFLNSANHKTGIKDVLFKTFAPIVFMFFIGVYTGAVLKISLEVLTESGVLGTFLTIFLIVITSSIISSWSHSKLFPATLKPINLILHPVAVFTKHRKNRATQKADFEKERLSIPKDEDGNWIYTDFVYDSSGEFKPTAEEEIKTAVLNELFERIQAGEHFDAETIEGRIAIKYGLIEGAKHYDTYDKYKNSQDAEKRKEKSKGKIYDS